MRVGNYLEGDGHMRKYITGILTALMVVSIGSTSLTAEAAAWHAGTPKALRGSWSWYAAQKVDPGWDTFHISAHKMVSQGRGNPRMGYHKLRYRSLGHGKYQIRAYERAIQPNAPKARWVTETFVKRHGRLKRTGYTPRYYHGSLQSVAKRLHLR